ncbi:serine protease [Pseudidiomarina tainanensis]|uniref:Serine protease n=1 Tax=Pseudidiomarina tainanensis TaxID=502365 RepID=A0ACD2HHP0_9GAMM|nr:trypsin-like serine protease [Pseudidiomarina tainanensis]RZQ55931.1 serine protease [Pseudidiomarina tainanensis]
MMSIKQRLASWRNCVLGIGLSTISIIVVATPIVIRHDVKDGSYLATQADFPPLATLYKIGAHGTLVHEKWVVTAAHTVFCVTPGTAIRIGDKIVEVKARYSHPDYERNGDNDIALIELAEPLNSPVTARLYAGSNEVGKDVWFIGSGGTGNGLTGQTVNYKENAGVLRKAQNRIESARGNEITFTFDKGVKALPLEGVSGNGDSGGPAFIKRGGEYWLLGISSRADSWFKEMGEYGVNEVYTRVSAHLPWIEAMFAATPRQRREMSSAERFVQPGIDDIDSICHQINYTPVKES